MYRYFPYNGGLVIKEYNVVTQTITDVVDFAGLLPWSGIAHVWTKEEGSPSSDGNIWCLMAEDSSFNSLGIFSYNMQTNTVVGTLNLTEDPDHISTSLTGTYCVPSSDGAMGTRAYSLDFLNFTQLLHKSEHSDLALDENNRDVFVTADYNSVTDGGWIKMVDMQTGIVTQLVDLYPFSGAAYSMHISGNAFEKPGYFVMATYGASLDYGATPAQYGDMWGHDKVAIVELKANPTIYNIAYMHNKIPATGGYFAEPHVSVNSDMTKILFASTWEQSNLNQLATYMITINDDSLIFENSFE